ncbi:hypothetical protein [Pedobacter sp. ASV28]|uniref:hypothetical protein n=1 Tax=Pedobacter sp. ASV28 TaxID=2795123 RepID=UPI0018EDDC1F|nr:hypothetical protein [Pedobacter sp. ASV28]
MTKHQEKLLQYFWDKKRHTYYEALPTHLITFLEHGTVGNAMMDSQLKLQLLELAKQRYLDFVDTNADVFKLTDEGKVFLSKRNSSFRDKIEQFNMSFPPMVTLITSMVGIVSVVVAIIQLIKQF